MIRVLGLIAVVGFIVSVACFAGAAALGGRELADNGWHISPHWRHMHDSAERDRWGDWGDWDEDTVDGGGPSASRDIAWDGSQTLRLDVPAEVRFTQGSGEAKLTITGPKGSVDHVIVDHGVIKFDQPMHHTQRLLIIMSAPSVTRFELNGDDKLAVAGFRQDRLAVDISGSAEATVEGAAKAFDLTISGSGEADLAKLTADAGKVDIAGSGRAAVAPATTADIDISGSGEVTLLSHPQNVTSNVSGSGRVIQGGAAKPS